ncbi:MAG: hypothetical protein MI723_18975, partial [Caulobacterales bacterium]|nr:hypothetical protein [Caulobacterales bacterium]
WAEAVAHLGDVPPRQRTERWRAAAEAAGAGHIRLLESQLGGDAAATAAKDLLIEFPMLKDAPAVREARADAIIDQADRCMLARSSDMRMCVEELERALELTPDDASLAREAGRLIERRWYARNAATFFLRAVEIHGGDFCQDDALVRSVIDAMGDPYGYRSANAARALAEGPCNSVVAEPLSARVGAAGISSPIVKNACPALLQAGVLTGLKRAVCEREASGG